MINTYSVPSSSEPGKEYQVTVGADGRLWCSCPAGQRDKQCKHVKHVREDLMNETETSTALVPVKLQPPATMLPSRDELRTINDLAMIAHSSAGIALPKELNTPQKVATVMLYGRELGVKPMTSLSQIYLVEGRPTPSAQVMAGILATKEPDSRLEILEADDKHAKLRLQRPSRGIDATYETTFADAEKAGLVKPGSMWQKYPKERNIYHCTKRILRMYAPEVIHALETADIFDEVQQAYNERQLPKRATVRELYNDEPNPAEAAIVMDSLTADVDEAEDDDNDSITILEPPITDEHSEQIQTWRARVMGEQGQAAMMRVIDWAGEQWPHALIQGAFKPRMLSGPQAEQLITMMETVATKGVSALGIECEHEIVFDEDKTVNVCGKCGLIFDGPPTEAPTEQAQGSLV